MTGGLTTDVLVLFLLYLVLEGLRQHYIRYSVYLMVTCGAVVKLGWPNARRR